MTKAQMGGPPKRLVMERHPLWHRPSILVGSRRERGSLVRLRRFVGSMLVAADMPDSAEAESSSDRTSGCRDGRYPADANFLHGSGPPHRRQLE